MVYQAHEARAFAGGGPLQHLQVAIGVAEGQDGATADDGVDAFRLAGAIVVVGKFWRAQN
ncbi:hypothetical protein D3C80_2073080 [compost metagenome]